MLEVMADLQPYCFEPECVPNPEDSESENEEGNKQLQGTFWCSCERCQIMPIERPEEENKIEGRILSLYCIGRSGWKNNLFLEIALDIKRWFNKAVSTYF